MQFGLVMIPKVLTSLHPKNDLHAHLQHSITL